MMAERPGYPTRLPIIPILLWNVAFLFCVGTVGAGEEPLPQNQDKAPNQPYSAAEAARRMVVPPGFQVEVVAAEPDLVNPVAMTFDERGRVWVTESLEYPRRSEGPGRDRIKILEDADGDGVMEKITIFADGLNIPSGIAVGGGGVWVANSPDILFLQDRDGDGKADHREVVLTGFGRFDTHELPNSLTWGPDGWLYGLNGVFNKAKITHQGRSHELTCGMFRIHPRTREFEVFAEGTSNPWGIAYNHEGDAFLSACVILHLWHITESGYYHRQAGSYPPKSWKIEAIVDYLHQKAAYCGITFFDSPAYPPQYREKLYMGNIHGNCINADRLIRNGATFTGKTEADFLTANDAWFMPVAQKTGPDGCLYILDWYDRYHCYQDANRDPKGIDRLKGRLYRVRYQNTPRRVNFDLSKESDDALITRLGDANVYDRDIAQRLLWERNTPEIRTKLEAMVLNSATPKKTRLYGLKALIGTGVITPSAHKSILADAEPAIRALAVRAVGTFPAGAPGPREASAERDTAGRTPMRSRRVDPEVVKAIVALADDPAPEVAVQVAVAARKLPGVDPLTVFARLIMRSGDDPLLPHILWENWHPLLGQNPEIVLNAVRNALGATDPASKPILHALWPQLAKHLGTTQLAQLVELIPVLRNRNNGEDEAADVLHAVRDRILENMHEKYPNSLIAAVKALLPADRSVKAKKIPPSAWEAWLCSALLGNAEQTRELRAYLESPSCQPQQRIDAFGVLLTGKDPTILSLIMPRILAGKIANEERIQLLDMLGEREDVRIATELIGEFSQLDPTLQPRVLELLTQRPTWSKLLLEAVAQQKITKNAINLNQIRRLQAAKDPAIQALAKAVFGIVREGRNPQRDLIIAKARNMMATAKGDAAKGAQVFTKLCGQCHKIYGQGQEVGPDITVNGRGSFEQLLSNVLDPSLVIGADYQATTVVTNDGRVISGLKVEDGPARIVLKIQGGKLENLPRNEIDEVKTSPLSLMPENLEEQLTPQEFTDLIEYLLWDRNPADPKAQRLPGSPKR